MIYFPTVQRSSSLPSHISMLGLRDEFPPHICWTSLPAWSSMWFVPACFLHFILLCSLSPCSVLAFCHSLPLPLFQFALPSLSFLFSKVCRFYLSTSGPQLMPNLATLLLTPIPFGPLYSNKTFFFFTFPFENGHNFFFALGSLCSSHCVSSQGTHLVQSCMSACPSDISGSRT